MQKTTKREYGIDLLRIISMMMVTMMHVNGYGGIINAATPFSAQYEFAWLLEDFFLVSINCFVMITGYVYFKMTAVKITFWDICHSQYRI